jgi:hypothetical protein
MYHEVACGTPQGSPLSPNKNDKRKLGFRAPHVMPSFPAFGQISLSRPSERGSFGRLKLYSIYYTIVIITNTNTNTNTGYYRAPLFPHTKTPFNLLFSHKLFVTFTLGFFPLPHSLNPTVFIMLTIKLIIKFSILNILLKSILHFVAVNLRSPAPGFSF